MTRILKFWHRWHDIIQVCGYIILLGTAASGLYVGFSFIEKANATAETVMNLEAFRHTTEIAQATENEDIKNIKDQLNRMENIQGKIFDGINHITDGHR